MRSLLDSAILQHIISFMPEPIISNETLIPEGFRDSFRQLIVKVDGIVDLSIIKPLSGGFSNSVPLLVYANYQNTGTYQVFKVGESSTIDAEARNWDSCIKNGPYQHQNILHKKEHLREHSDSLIIYNFAGQLDKEPITFEDLYERDRNPENTLAHLFQNVLRPLSDVVSRGTSRVQIGELLKINQGNVREITEEIKRLSNNNDICAIHKIDVHGNEVFNPLYFYPFNNSQPPQALAIPVPMGIVHGDLNARNIVFYPSDGFIREALDSKLITVEIPCIIDYAHTGEKPLYTDIAKLESVLKFQHLKVSSIQPDMLLQFEVENVIRTIVPSSQPTITDPHLQKLFSCIKVLREIAAAITRDAPAIGYWLELYKNTLIHITYDDLSDLQKRYAFISAALILKRHLTE